MDFPWLESQGHASYAWSVLVAQKAATVQLLSQGRCRLGLGSGENLNEHVVGGGWPAVDVENVRARGVW